MTLSAFRSGSPLIVASFSFQIIENQDNNISHHKNCLPKNRDIWEKTYIFAVKIIGNLRRFLCFSARQRGVKGIRRSEDLKIKVPHVAGDFGGLRNLFTTYCFSNNRTNLSQTTE